MNGLVGLIDYGAGNLFSLENALSRLGYKAVRIESDDDWVSEIVQIVLPGVGAFREGMASLEERKLVNPIKKLAKDGGRIIGICLGAQLLMNSSTEFGFTEGLGLIPGTVVQFDLPTIQVPNIGWSPVKWNSSEFSLNQEEWMYFVHSYHMKPEYDNHVLATSTISDNSFVAAIEKGNIMGVQFHPEKSGDKGLAVLDQLIRRKLDGRDE